MTLLDRLADAVGRGAGSESDIPLEDLLEAISNERRRRVLRRVDDVEDGEEIGLGDLAEFLASVENDCPVSAVSSDQRKATYVALYQCHVPKLVEWGLVQTGEQGHQVRSTRATPTAVEAISSMESIAGGER